MIRKELSYPCRHKRAERHLVRMVIIAARYTQASYTLQHIAHQARVALRAWYHHVAREVGDEVIGNSGACT